MVSLDSEPSRDDFKGCKDNRASQCEDGEYGQSDHRDTFAGGARPRKFGEEEESDHPQPENGVQNGHNVYCNEAGRQVQNPGASTLGGCQQNTQRVNCFKERQLVWCGDCTAIQ